MSLINPNDFVIAKSTHESHGRVLHTADACPQDATCPVWAAWNRGASPSTADASKAHTSPPSASHAHPTRCLSADAPRDRFGVPHDRAVRIGYARKSDDSVSSSWWEPSALRDAHLSSLMADPDIDAVWYRLSDYRSASGYGIAHHIKK